MRFDTEKYFYDRVKKNQHVYRIKKRYRFFTAPCRECILPVCSHKKKISGRNFSGKF